jgi:hypothetical protein
LRNVNTRKGNIEVHGDVGGVTATVSGSGNIQVCGANGDVALATDGGSILADILPGHNVAVRAATGNIEIRADAATVSAGTSNGNIRFVGSLRPGSTHQFTVKETGNIQVAVPIYPDTMVTTPVTAPRIVYRFNISTAANPVEIEYPAHGAATGNPASALPICGFIHSSGPYDYHIENTPAALGRIEISPVITSTYFFTGTLATNYFRFDTNQTRVSFFTPITQSIHIYTAAQLNQIKAGQASIVPECEAALSDNLKDAITLTLTTESGLVYVHHRLMR